MYLRQTLAFATAIVVLSIVDGTHLSGPNSGIGGPVNTIVSTTDEPSDDDYYVKIKVNQPTSDDDDNTNDDVLDSRNIGQLASFFLATCGGLLVIVVVVRSGLKWREKRNQQNSGWDASTATGSRTSWYPLRHVKSGQVGGKTSSSTLTSQDDQTVSQITSIDIHTENSSVTDGAGSENPRNLYVPHRMKSEATYDLAMNSSDQNDCHQDSSSEI